jgi:hypothetical protein
MSPNCLTRKASLLQIKSRDHQPEMNSLCEKDESLTSQNQVVTPSKGEVNTVPSNIIRHRQGILESTRIDDGYEDTHTCRKPNARVKSYPVCLHKHINKERPHWGRSSSTRAISGKTPLQQRSRRRMNGGPSHFSAKKSHKDIGTGEAHQRGRSAFERLQQSDSKWNSDSWALADRLPLHEKIEAKCASTKENHKEPSVEEPIPVDSIRSLQQCGARLSSDYRASFDMAPSKALARRRKNVESSSVSAINGDLIDAVKMENRATLLETRLESRRLSGTPRRPSVFRFARSSGLSPRRYNRIADREALVQEAF